MPTLQPIHSEDSALVARIASGDQIAENEFVHKYFEHYEYLARRYRIPEADCQDVAQETLITAFSQMQRGLFRGDCKLATWLGRIFHGTMVNYRRKQKGVALVTLDEPGKIRDEVEARPSRRYDYELQAIVHETVASLPQPHRTILLFIRNEGYKPEEFSRVSEMPVGQVRNKLYAAEEMFRRRLSGNRPPDAPLDLKARNRALSPGRTHSSEGNHEQSKRHRFFIRLFGAGDQQDDHSLLLWARERTGAAFGRSASVRMRMLFARGEAAGCGRACAGYGSKLAAIAHVC